MNFDDYQKKAVRTWGLASDVAAHDGYDDSSGAYAKLITNLREEGASETSIEKIENLATRLNISALANGLTGEAGEVADEIKKFAGHGHWKDGVDLEKEIGDVLWYAAAVAECMGFSLNEIAEKNIAKLEKRYKAGFSTQGSMDREDLG